VDKTLVRLFGKVTAIGLSTVIHRLTTKVLPVFIDKILFY